MLVSVQRIAHILDVRTLGLAYMSTWTRFSTLGFPTNSISVFRECAAYDVSWSIIYSAFPYLRPRGLRSGLMVVS